MPARTNVRAQPCRYPLQPLLDRIGGSATSAARKLGISGSTEQDYKRRGVTERVADRLAARAGLVAYEVWPEILDHAIAAEMRTCALADCTEAFVPSRSTSRYCSKLCGDRARRRAYQARKAATDPEWVERRRQQRRDYYLECGEYERAQQRRRDAAKRAKGRAA
ncbi:MAG TPA: CGNR zinc finger domain-containing protein [Propionibacteriaceae bacterium]|nr:CGNR zinc finger domain-containing protein [Propionibacteriaceae bacterium]